MPRRQRQYPLSGIVLDGISDNDAVKALLSVVYIYLPRYRYLALSRKSIHIESIEMVYLIEYELDRLALRFNLCFGPGPSPGQWSFYECSSFD
jgi:hypothetical protein